MTPGLKVFLSYHSSDRTLAGEIKFNLNRYGMDVFLAHEDIQPTEEWQARILSELKRTDAFLPLLTEKFITSKWTSQECGVAVARGIFIVSLKVSIDPFGFLSKYQAFNFRIENIPRSCSGIAKVIHKNRKLQRKFLDGLITLLGHSRSFDEAKATSALLNDFGSYNGRQVNDIIRKAIENPQVHKSFGARRQLEIFLKKYEADEAIVRSYRKLTSEQ
ncbi:MAG TPA: toll/interleukin-1 receptor domain-containing protein [Candidatus Acidoferrales bacterium]|nr:toll/interleukin-1 receptor domain-containing protein [Candidatus Acidoferrales bacterium]